MITVASFFTNNGTPATGLFPTIKIREVVSNSVIINGDMMSEMGDGWYKYDFNGNEDLDYIIVCDGGSALTTAERYTFAGTELKSNLITVHDDLARVLGLCQENYRIINPVYDSLGNLTAGKIKIYPTSADVDTDTNAIAEYEITATYGTGKLRTNATGYKVKKI